jgi:hypothetical protein
MTMLTDTRLFSRFEPIRDGDEQIYWVGKPAFVPFIVTGIPFLIFGFLWGAFDYFGFIRNMNKMPNGFLGFAIPFFAIHLAPFWLSILNMVRLFLVHGNTFYAFSNKRLLARSGFWGTDFKTVDYDKISDLEVNVNPIENIFQVGTIRAFSGRTTSKGAKIYDRFMAVVSPYEVFKRIKEVSVDIKTDWNYPNALRPDENPGYRTNYEPKVNP